MIKCVMNLEPNEYLDENGNGHLYMWVAEVYGVKFYANRCDYDPDAASIGLDGWLHTVHIENARVSDDRVNFPTFCYIIGAKNAKKVDVDESFRCNCEDNGSIEWRVNKKKAERQWVVNAERLRKMKNSH